MSELSPNSKTRLKKILLEAGIDYIEEDGNIKLSNKKDMKKLQAAGLVHDPDNPVKVTQEELDKQREEMMQMMEYKALMEQKKLLVNVICEDPEHSKTIAIISPSRNKAKATAKKLHKEYYPDAKILKIETHEHQINIEEHIDNDTDNDNDNNS